MTPATCPKLQAEYTKKGVVWLAVDSSAPGKEGYLAGGDAAEGDGRRLSSRQCAADRPDGKVGHLYGATNTPDMFIVDPDGKLIY